MSDLTQLTVSEIRKGLEAKTFTAGDLADACLNKAERLKDLNCFITLDADKIKDQAKAADQKIKAGEKGPLLGIPVAIKDVLVTEGTKTTCGSKILSNFIPPYSATVIKKLSAAGAVMFGKTNMDEFAMGSSNENSAFGPVKNPWDTSRVPGGSSGGSAAVVASRITPLSLGTDTGGSIRQPASFCNLVGMKPTYGRVSRYGLVAFASSLDQIGPFATNVSDCAAITNIISGHDASDSTSMTVPVPDFSKAIGQSIKGLRVGVPKEYFVAGLTGEVKLAVDSALKKLESLGANIVEISLPHTEAAVAAYYILAPAEASSNLARFDGVRYGVRASGTKDVLDLYCKSRSEGFGKEVRRRIMIGAYVLSAGYFDAYYLRAQKVRALIKRDFDLAFADKCDVIACPTAPSTAFKIGEKSSDPISMYLNDVFTIPVNLAGLPGISIPCGFDKSNLPIGLQFIGKPWGEEDLFKFASAYESATDWHKQLPKVS